MKNQHQEVQAQLEFEQEFIEIDLKEETGKLVHQLCISRRLEDLKSLIEKEGRGYLNFVDDLNQTCAHLALRNQDLRLLKYLSENGFRRWNLKDRKTRATPLRLCVEIRRFDCAELIISKSDQEILNEGLRLACEIGLIDWVKFFVLKGADCSWNGHLQMNAFCWACHNGHLEIVGYLLANAPKSIVNQAQTFSIATPLILAAVKGHVQIVEELVKNGANVNHVDVDNISALFAASYEGHLNVVESLLKNGADPNMNRIDQASPLIMAAENGRIEIVELLLKNGANVNQSKKEGQTALARACFNGHCKVVEMLLRYGADRNCKDLWGDTALDNAKKKNHREIVQVLEKESTC